MKAKSRKKFKLDFWTSISILSFLVFVVFLIYPMFSLFIQSFKDVNSGKFTLDNFAMFFSKVLL